MREPNGESRIRDYRERNMKASMVNSTLLVLLVFCSALFAAGAFGQDAGQADEGEINKALGTAPYSPYADRKYPSRPLFGDTHLHTGVSMDAGLFGARLTPRDAYRFARGEQVTASGGQPARLARPLDFLVVTDHSDNMGFATDLIAGDAALLAHPKGREWYDMIQQGRGGEAALELIGLFSQGQFRKSCFMHRAPAPIAIPGRKISTRPRPTMSRAASPPSSVTNGPLW